MQNLKQVLAVCIFSLLFLEGASVEANTAKPNKITYQDLRPEVRRQIDCLADNIYFEAGYEPPIGQKAVALVTLNRVESKMFADTICQVVKQRRQSVCQFSWWCDPKARSKAVRRQFDKEAYEQARIVALHVYFNYNNINDITKGALFFHSNRVNPRWRHLRVTTKIGQHIFYRTGT